ncbi:olfactory receptor 4B13-like [Nothobranchius furzeri]|uniref:Olfactory receptor 142-like n=1 Tax=Nothobranchius furzeri TaxID=105023 RepID=A0A9D2Y9T2_NOTFU|nr:olfactory receptor 142-like [Nothobranchius furzeri]KAF7216137.1 olfactory receptor 142-like [Nothobranchius furzeri]
MDNVSVVRIFTLAGINETMDYRIAIFSLSLIYYCVILFLNFSLVFIIVLDENLHEPMYVLLCSICINAVYGTTGFYPKFLFDLFSFSQEISYEGCLLQAFVMHSYACCDLSILAVMAYDRYLAICHPLHYHSSMTRRKLAQLITFSWLTPFCILSLGILLATQLQLCSTKIKKLFCVNWTIVQLACSHSNTFSNVIISYAAIIIYVSHGIFIMWTYMCLVKTCTRSKDNRVRFMQTCVPHLVSLVMFLVVVLFDLMYMRFGSTDLPQSLQNFIALEFLVLPPLMNPLIYGFKLTKIRNKIMSLVYVDVLL